MSRAFSTFISSPACSSTVLTPSRHRSGVLSLARLLGLSRLAPCFLGGQATDAMKTSGGTMENAVGSWRGQSLARGELLGG